MMIKSIIDRGDKNVDDTEK